MPFKGTIQKLVPYDCEITPAVGNTDSTAMVYENISAADKIQSIDTQTIPTSQASATHTHTAAAGVVRLQISISPPPLGLAQFRLVQGTTVITHDVTGDCMLSFDVVP